MSWLGDIFGAVRRTLAGRRAEARDVIGSWRPSDPAVAALFGLTSSDPDTAGIAIDGDLAASVATAFACVSRIAGTISSCPMKVVRDDGSYAPSSHPGGRLFLRPNAETTWPAVCESLIASACLHKGGFAEIVWGANTQPLALHVLDPRRVEIKRTASGQLLYLHQEDNGPQTALFPEDVLHVRGCFSWDGVRPLDRVQLARRALALSIAGDRFALEYFANSGAPEGFISFPGSLGETGVENLRRSFKLHHSRDRRHNVAILEEGATYNPLSNNAQESQLQEQRLGQCVEICRFFDVPPALVGVLEASSYASVEMAVEMFKLFSITRWAKHFEAELNGKLFRGSGSYCKVNLDAVLRGSTSERMDNYGKAHAIGLWDVDELREMEDAPPVKGGDRRLEPLNHQALATAGERDELELEKLRIEVDKLRREEDQAQERAANPPPEPPPAAEAPPANRIPPEFLEQQTNGNGNGNANGSAS